MCQIPSFTPWGTVLRVGLLCLGASVLASCSQTGGLKLSAAPTEVPVEKALAFPPPGGLGIVSVIERNYSNAVQQDIAITTDARSPGQNYIKVRYFGPSSTPFAGSSRLSMLPLSTGDAVRIMRREFPGIRMSLSPSYVQNNYGAFSYAYGTDSGQGDSCLFGWQQIRAPDSYVRTFRYLGMIQTQVRICQTGASRESLLAMMYNYTLTGAFDSVGWNPYGTVPELDPSIGQLGKPIYPASVGTQPAPSSLPMSSNVVVTPAPRPTVRAAVPRVSRAVERRVSPRPQVPSVFIPSPTTILRSSTAGMPVPADGASLPVIPQAPVIPSAPCADTTLPGCQSEQ
jgi:hypothetical protein